MHLLNFLFVPSRILVSTCIKHIQYLYISEHSDYSTSDESERGAKQSLLTPAEIDPNIGDHCVCDPKYPRGSQASLTYVELFARQLISTWWPLRTRLRFIYTAIC